MKVTRFDMDGPLLIEPKIFGDARGFFVERFHRDRFLEAGIPADQFVQDNYSRSTRAVLRGLHYQFQEPQGKLVTATQGRIFDVVVDIRASSATFGQYFGIELDGDRPTWLWVPAGFAHGFAVLSDSADILYKTTSIYNPKGEGGILWNDPDLKIAWPVPSPILSARDLAQSSFRDYKLNPPFK